MMSLLLFFNLSYFTGLDRHLRRPCFFISNQHILQDLIDSYGAFNRQKKENGTCTVFFLQPILFLNVEAPMNMKSLLFFFYLSYFSFTELERHQRCPCSFSSQPSSSDLSRLYQWVSTRSVLYTKTAGIKTPKTKIFFIFSSSFVLIEPWNLILLPNILLETESCTVLAAQYCPYVRPSNFFSSGFRIIELSLFFKASSLKLNF